MTRIPTPTTASDVVTAAMSLADDAAQGRLDPAALEAQAVAELRQLVGTVVGPDDSAWPLQCDIARQVIALGGVSADELAEWLAVARRRAGEPVTTPEPDPAPPEVETLPSVALRAESANAAPDLAEAETSDHSRTADTAPEPEVEPVASKPTPVPPARSDQYEPLRGWSPGGTRRN